MTTLAETRLQTPGIAPDARATGSPDAAATDATAPWSLYSSWQRWGFLSILFLVTTSNYFDYYVLSVVLEPIKQEFHASDTKLGLLSGICFAVVYAAAGLPIARWADRGNRRTVIIVALTGWSVMTTACGLAQSFWQLALARFGLGLTEPGAMPPAQSLIADYFPPRRRATASAILNAGSAAGYLVGVGLGGYIAATRGWRAAFLMAGVPGILLAIIARWGLGEPRCQLGFSASKSKSESMSEAFSHLRHKQTFVLALVGTSVYMMFSYGVGIFLPSFMMRTLHATLTQVSITWGSAVSVANLVGALLGGLLADRLSRRDIRWYAWLPALACALAAPVYLMALLADQLSTFIVIDSIAECMVAIGMSVCFAAVHAVCGNKRRTMAISIVQFSYMLVGCGLGPVLAGALSDGLSLIYGTDSLRYSLIVMVLFLAPAAAAFYRSGHTLRSELEDT